MKKLLSANLQVWHLLVGIAFIAMAMTGGVVIAGPYAPPVWGEAKVDAAAPAAFVPEGTMRMATAFAEVAQYVKATDGVVTVLSASFSVPSGQTADIAAFFNAAAYKYPNGYCYVEFFLDSAGLTLRPDRLWVVDGYIYKGGYPTISAQGFRGAIGPGNHTVFVKMETTGGDCYVNHRSLIVMANLR
jgi:hypothetical protein